MKLFVLGITGTRGAGKDTVANYLKRKYGFRVLTYTKDVLGPILKKRGKQIARENLIRLALKLRKEKGKDVLTRMISKKVGREGFWAISGIRYPEEDRHFRRFFGRNYRLLNVHCLLEKRYRRVKRRGTKGEARMSLEEFKKIERRETEKKIRETVKLADFLVDNNGSRKDLYKAIDGLALKVNFSNIS